MKIQSNTFLPLLLVVPELVARIGSVSAQPPGKRKGHFKKFDKSPGGGANIELFEGGPSIQCQMKNGKGNGNPQYCRSGFTSVTMVDAECPDNGNGKSNLFLDDDKPNGKKCFAASITEGETGKIYTINSAGEVLERDTEDYPDEEHAPNEDGGGPSEDDVIVDDRRSLRGSRETTDRSLQATPVIDVLVVYTQGAKADAQNYGDGPIENLINLAIAETNMAYQNSGINAEIRLAAMHEDTSGYTADVGSTSMSPSLRHLTYTAGNSNDPDGLLDYVHQMRTDVGADMVALITTGAGCGIAWLSGNCQTCYPSAGSQFSVTKYSCATGYFSFGHELGHNMGAHHDKGTTNQCGSSDYRYGFRDPNGQYRSVLSYSCNTSQCDSNPGGPCTRSPFFSNPNFTWNGGPMGAQAGSALGLTDNARRITERAEHISNFYTATVTPAPNTAQPTNPPTPAPTKTPTTPNPTPAPVTPNPTAPPTPNPTNTPTDPPTPSPTPAPVTPNPTAPPTPNPTNPPTAPPTPNPTNPPTDFSCALIGDRSTCNNDSRCSWSGKRNNGNCVESGGTGGCAAPGDSCRDLPCCSGSCPRGKPSTRFCPN